MHLGPWDGATVLVWRTRPDAHMWMPSRETKLNPGRSCAASAQTLVALWKILTSLLRPRLLCRHASDIGVTELPVSFSAQVTPRSHRLSPGGMPFDSEENPDTSVTAKADFPHPSVLGQDPVHMGKVFAMASSYKMNTYSLGKHICQHAPGI